MFRKIKIIMLVVSAFLLLFTSCSKKIIGATPHRRDRHCGCENIPQTRCDTLNYTPLLTENR